MGKLIIISNDKKTYKMDIYLNNQLVCNLNPSEKKYFEIQPNTYSIYCFSKHSQSSSTTEVIDLNKNVKVEISQGFTNPKMNFQYISAEELSTYNGKDFNKIETSNILIQTVNETLSSKMKTNCQKRNQSVLSIIGTCILALILFYFGINRMVDGNEKVMNQDSNNTPEYSYTIESQGLDENGIYKIKGKITNNTSKNVDGLQIEFKCYDEERNYLDTINACTENLDAGETWKYEASDYLKSDKISKCEYYQITPYVKIIELH